MNESLIRPPAYARQLPGLTPDNRSFWTGGGEGKLLIYRCSGCGLYHHPPLPHCGACGTPEPKPVAVSGRGRVASYTINHHPWVADMPVPVVIAAVELVEQSELYVLSNIFDCEPEDVAIGMPVEVRFEQHGELFLPVFVPEVRG